MPQLTGKGDEWVDKEPDKINRSREGSHETSLKGMGLQEVIVLITLLLGYLRFFALVLVTA